MQKLFRSDTSGSTSALRMTPFLIEANNADTLALFASLTEKPTVAAKSSSLVGSIALLVIPSPRQPTSPNTRPVNEAILGPA